MIRNALFGLPPILADGIARENDVSNVVRRNIYALSSSAVVMRADIKNETEIATALQANDQRRGWCAYDMLFVRELAFILFVGEWGAILHM